MAAFLSGDVSLYRSTLPLMPEATDFSIPVAEMDKFFVLTNHGIFTLEIRDDAFVQDHGPLSSFHEASQSVIHELILMNGG